MNFPIDACPITGLPIKETDVIQHRDNPHLTEYTNPIIGRVILTLQSYLAIQQSEDKDLKSILAAICRHHFEKYKKGFELKYDFVKSGYKDYPHPLKFREKVYSFLKYLYENGGEEYKSFRVITDRDYPLAYAINQDEFIRIIKKLEVNYFINIEDEVVPEDGIMIIAEFTLTESGIEEIEKDLPKLPMIGLVDQEISTGNLEVDEKINHAKKLFFKDNSTMDDKRSACETLSFILEPIRDDLKKYFTNSDVNDFFNIVNNFDIRHNKEHTKSIEYEEQLEWIFYSLLNTITAYIKLKDKL